MFHTSEKQRVHHQLVAALRHERISHLAYGHHLGRRIGLVKTREYHHHTVEQLARLLERKHRIGKCRLVSLAGDLLHLLLAAGYALLDSGQIVVVGDLLKRRNVELRAIRHEKWILALL